MKTYHATQKHFGWAALACVVMVFACPWAGFAGPQEMPFLRIAGQNLHAQEQTQEQKQEQEQAQALIANFFPPKEAPYNYDPPFSLDGESLEFTQDPQTLPLEGWPTLRLEYRNQYLYLHKGNTTTHLGYAGENEAPDWPKAAVHIADIDFDGQPDFFVLTSPAYSGSWGYTLLQWNRTNKQGKSLFVPFSLKKLAPPADGYKPYLVFHKGEGSNPNFYKEKQMLEFINRNGPYYDTERWCFAQGRYALCETIQQSYYANADNMYELARHVRYDRQGNVLEIYCRALNDPTAQPPVLFAAAGEVGLFGSPSLAAPSLGTLNPGDVVLVQDYYMDTDESNPALWFKVAKIQQPEAAGWVRARVEEPVVKEGTLTVGWPEFTELTVLGVRPTSTGGEILVQQGTTQFVLPNVPIITQLQFF